MRSEDEERCCFHDIFILFWVVRSRGKVMITSWMNDETETRTHITATSVEYSILDTVSLAANTSLLQFPHNT